MTYFVPENGSYTNFLGMGGGKSYAPGAFKSILSIDRKEEIIGLLIIGLSQGIKYTI